MSSVPSSTILIAGEKQSGKSAIIESLQKNFLSSQINIVNFPADKERLLQTPQKPITLIELSEYSEKEGEDISKNFEHFLKLNMIESID